MNSDVTNGPWRRFRIQVRKTWSELTDEDLETISRDSDDLVHVVQHRYGCKWDKATKPPRIADRDFLADQWPSESARLHIRVGNGTALIVQHQPNQPN